MDCIANTIYHEARAEGPTAMRAVAQVILNRSRLEGKNPCIIVQMPHQFAVRGVINDIKSWNLAKQIALHPGKDFTGGATAFHNKSVRPYWSYKWRITYTFGSHIFYKNPRQN